MVVSDLNKTEDCIIACYSKEKKKKEAESNNKNKLLLVLQFVSC
jgi:hypothetical protein